MRRETTASHADSEGILSIYSTGFYTLVAKNAFRVIANVELVIDFGWLGRVGSGGAVSLGIRAISF
jgi:hypothetical protein